MKITNFLTPQIPKKMNKILFKGYSKQHGWVQGTCDYYIDEKGVHCIIVNAINEEIIVDKDTIGRIVFSKGKTDVFEGDRVRYKLYDGNAIHHARFIKGTVVYDERRAKFVIMEDGGSVEEERGIYDICKDNDIVVLEREMEVAG